VGDDIVGGGGGFDVLDGGEGNDTLTFEGIGRNVDANLATNSAIYVAPNGTTIQETSTNFENLTGFTGDDRLTGDEGDNVLWLAAMALMSSMAVTVMISSAVTLSATERLSRFPLRTR